VNLPDAPQLVGFPVPITAFIDVNRDGLPAGEPSNITIDRVYTNYLKLEKKARLLEADGTTFVAPADGSYTTDQTALSTSAKPGRIIQYQITYTNISETGGTDSVILPANNLVITEDGSTAPNTWFGMTTDPVYAGSGVGTAVDTPGAGGTAGVITITAGGTDIKVYIDTISTVAPGKNGVFTFKRKIK
jgi:hypothetical protein